VVLLRSRKAAFGEKAAAFVFGGAFPRKPIYADVAKRVSFPTRVDIVFQAGNYVFGLMV
jgi:hypothetical protein